MCHNSTFDLWMTIQNLRESRPTNSLEQNVLLDNHPSWKLCVHALYFIFYCFHYHPHSDMKWFHLLSKHGPCSLKPAVLWCIVYCLRPFCLIFLWIDMSYVVEVIWPGSVKLSADCALLCPSTFDMWLAWHGNCSCRQNNGNKNSNIIMSVASFYFDMIPTMYVMYHNENDRLPATWKSKHTIGLRIV